MGWTVTRGDHGRVKIGKDDGSVELLVFCDLSGQLTNDSDEFFELKHVSDLIQLSTQLAAFGIYES